MASVTRTTKAGNITRRITITYANSCGRCEVRVVEQQKNKITDDTYLVERLPSDFGIAFRARKLVDDGEQYDVCLNVPGGGHSCDCKWATYKGHLKPCRHVEMCLQALRERKF